MDETIKLEFSQNELKLLLVALDAFNHRLENKSTRSKVLIGIHKSERFFNFDFDVIDLISDLPQFLNTVLGKSADKLYDAYFQLASNNGTLKPELLQDERYSFQDLIPFLDIDLKNSPEAL